MDIHVLDTFVAVCEYSGFSAAAEKLGYTQSTVSSQIRQLEADLGTVLFDRFYHRISLTADGVVALEYARSILGSHKEMLAALKKSQAVAGDIRLAMSSSICNRYFRGDFLAFRQRYPGINLVVIESGTEQMFDMLRKNEADLVFTLDSHIYHSEFVICAEREENVRFVAAANHPLLTHGPLTLEKIAGADFVLTESSMSYRRLLDDLLSSRSLEIRPVLEIGNPLQICSIVAESSLVSFLPDFITRKYIQRGELAALPVEDCGIRVWTQLLLHKNKWRSPALNAFIDFYREIISEGP